jgi:hypothetical protein
MSVEVVTKEDLQILRVALINDFRLLMREADNKKNEPMEEGYKTKHLRKILGCSVNKLYSLRISRKLRTKKVGGTIYYNKDDVKRLVDEGY